LAHFIGNRVFMRMADGHCAALAVRVGPDGIAHHRCTIYAERPQVCRDLERGSPHCEAERLRKPEIAIAGLPAAEPVGDNRA